MTAVVRSSTGEAVVLLSSDALRRVPEATLADMFKAAAAVLSAAELQAVHKVVPELGTGLPDFRVRVEGRLLTAYRLAVG
ncbi:hypothetical protein ABZ484_07205 [Streptomyces sp. NPDC006393]|uniref:hypothetical protein n=1 Tax=Streptomyces sp. NPDC006393 TaxID=3156763 RepID=UPI0033EF407E